MHIKSIENPFLKIWIDKNIIHGVFKSTSIDLNAAKQCVKDRLMISEGVNYPTLIDIRQIKAVNQEARNYFASSEGIAFIKYAAIITDSFISKMIGAAFLTFNKPAVPVKVFTNEKEALKWLMEFPDINLN